MQQNQVNFILLQFSRRFNDDEAIKMLLVHFEDEGPLQVWISPNWAERVETVDWEYLYDLMGDWRSTPPDQVSALAEELSRQSQSPIKVLDRGHVSVAECEALIQNVMVELRRNL